MYQFDECSAVIFIVDISQYPALIYLLYIILIQMFGMTKLLHMIQNSFCPIMCKCSQKLYAFPFLILWRFSDLSQANTKWFYCVPVILLFDKRDLFEAKIKRTDLCVCFPEYTGGCDYGKAISFLKQEFLDKVYQRYVHKIDRVSILPLFIYLLLIL